LKYLHEELESPIYHLDLKPANILLDENMLPKITDFGISRFFGEEQTHITKSSVGTWLVYTISRELKFSVTRILCLQ